MDASLYTALSELLEYPGPRLGGQVAACLGRLGPRHGDAARRLAEFARAVEGAPRGALQESYAAAFDLDPTCSPHVGFRLLGPDPRRGVFLARLAARYRERGFSAGRELPDHVAVLLRYLAHAPVEPDRAELVGDCLVPALSSLARELERRRHPYAPVAEAIRLVLEEDAREAP
ncbi:nitrate reductase molybdenum cofactor assembly chaperone [Anaeromyxobacter oryzisoli]|uniref:nitrate reductase molybdenum cofactor assembly chaperone n=1 Tax=Anaeromyxobacter oryzisoli TaxID=2925408 RepID=UPI001F569D9B|nr:molecular chaperone TorD family protein [Anaeromyxobacter sp. SG63]